MGACHPEYAYQALEEEDKIGTMLPFNIIVQEMAEGDIEISAVDPIASKQVVKNTSSGGIAREIQEWLHRIIERI